MPTIKILSEVVASQIAAGEVIQRPSSVVRELVDNSLDAGAGRISVDVRKGGNESIRVVDDGCGISREDLPLVLKRHATSKIELESDLQSIRTYGFRGEAMAAISSVSRTEIISRLPGERQGYRLIAEGGEIRSIEPVGAPPGTAVTVSDLFFNTPARRKFMKSPTTEMERVGEVVVRAALSRPEIHFELSHGERRSRRYQAVPSRIDRIVQVLGDSIAKELLPVDHTADPLGIEGFVSRPTTHRKSAGDIYLFVNGRFVRDRLLMRAIAEAYRASLPQRRYPVVVLFVTLPPEEVDVNVHPAKEEIRFRDEARIWRACYAAVRDALTGSSPRVWVGLNEEPETPVPPVSPEKEENTEESVNVAEVPSRQPQETDEAMSPEIGVHGEVSVIPGNDDEKDAVSLEPEHPVLQKLEELNRIPLQTESVGDRSPDKVSSEPGNVHRDSWRVVAQVFDSFILCESGEEMALFDQHALHERLQFEKLRRQFDEGGIESQTLMFPLTLEFTGPEGELLNGVLDLFNGLGLEIEPFGDTTFIVRAIPADLELSEVRPLVEDALADLAEIGVVAPFGDRAEKVLARMACRSAVKANEPLDTAQMQLLIDQYTENPILSTCPHGRPPIWKITRRELEKLFDRP